MRNILKKLWPFALFFTLSYYISGYAFPLEVQPVILLLFHPLCIIGASIFYTIKHSFKWYFLLMIPLLFVPACFLLYNDSALFYVITYLVLTAAGQGIGCLIRISMKK